MSITSFRLARESQEVKEKEMAAAAPAEEARPVPAEPVERKIASEPVTSTVKAKPKTTIQK